MRLVVGRIVRPHGVRGEVVVAARTDRREDRFAPGRSLHAAEHGPLTVRSARAHGGRLLVRFAGVTGREAAERLRGVELAADVEDEPQHDPEVYLDADLVGLDVRGPDDEAIGTVVAVEHLPMHDLLVVGRGSRTDVRVPFAAAIVPHVDVDAGWLRIDPPAGLLVDDPEG